MRGGMVSGVGGLLDTALITAEMTTAAPTLVRVRLLLGIATG